MSWLAKEKGFRARTVARFEAPDPWNGQRSAEWSIEGFVWGPKSWTGLPKAMVKKPLESYGLRSEIDGIVRALPDSLGHLVRTGAVPHAALPALLAEVGPSLQKRDFQPYLYVDVRRRLIYFFGFGAAFLALWLFLQAIFPATPTVADRNGFFRILVLAIGATSVIMVAIVAPIWLRRLKRRDQQMDWALERVRSSHV